MTSSSTSKRNLWWALGIYALFTSALLWPLWPKLDTRLPLGTEEVRTVPLFNQWTIWWNADRLSHFADRYWQAPIFYPDTNTFAYSEPQPLTMLLAPAVWLGSATLAYNLYVAISLLLNGWLTHWVLRWLGYGWLATASGALMMIALPMVHWQLGVVQLVPLWGIIWTLWAWARLQSTAWKIADRRAVLSTADETPKFQHLASLAVELGIALAITSWMAIYHALFLTTLLVPAVLVFGRRLFHRQVAASLVMAGVTCCVLISPMVPPMLQLAKNPDFVRPADIVQRLSLMPSDYLSIHGQTIFSELYWEPARYWRINPGWSKLGLAALGLLASVWTPVARRWTALLMLMLVTAFALSLGSNLKIGTWNLWESLASTLPGFQQVRSPFRYAYFVQLLIVLAAAGGIQQLWSWASHCGTRSAQVLRRLAVIGLASLALIDPLPGTLRMCVVPDLANAKEWCSVLEQASLTAPGAALCLPMAMGDEARDFEQTCTWMIYGTLHHVPLVNGYSGFCPQRVLDLGTETAERPITSQRVLQLFEQGVRYLVVDRNMYALPYQADQAVGDLKLKLLISSRTGVDVYQLQKP